ncbi:MAG: flagellar export chaperone FliS [Desulfobacteria bacterium]
MRKFDAYRKSTFDMSDNVRIVSLLFDGAINFIKLGRIKMGERDTAGKGLYIGKATAIVGELTSSLNMEAGGEIARNLRRLYDFVLDRLLKANLKNDGIALDEAEKVLQTLREGWKGMERNQAAAHAAPLTASGSAGMTLRA